MTNRIWLLEYEDQALNKTNRFYVYINSNKEMSGQMAEAITKVKSNEHYKQSWILRKISDYGLTNITVLGMPINPTIFQYDISLDNGMSYEKKTMIADTLEEVLQANQRTMLKSISTTVVRDVFIL